MVVIGGVWSFFERICEGCDAVLESVLWCDDWFCVGVVAEVAHVCHLDGAGLA